MKFLLILVILLSGCDIKNQPQVKTKNTKKEEYNPFTDSNNRMCPWNIQYMTDQTAS